MYLLTFVFLVIGVLGIYTQVLGVQAARMAAMQSGIGQTMIFWHAGAVSLAGHVMAPPATPCSLTSEFTIAGTLTNCAAGNGGNRAPGTPVTVMGNGTYVFPAVNGYTFPALPVGTNGFDPNGSTIYHWKSVAFQGGGGYYVITYVDAPAGGGFISTATAQIGITLGDLYLQLLNNGVQSPAIGYVSAAGGTLITKASLNIAGVITPLTYTIPAAPIVTPNALAIISSVTPCGTC